MSDTIEQCCAGCGHLEAKVGRLTHCPGCKELVCDDCGRVHHKKCIDEIIADCANYEGAEPCES